MYMLLTEKLHVSYRMASFLFETCGIYVITCIKNCADYMQVSGKGGIIFI